MQLNVMHVATRNWCHSIEYAAGEHKQHARNQPVAADYGMD